MINAMPCHSDGVPTNAVCTELLAGCGEECARARDTRIEHRGARRRPCSRGGGGGGATTCRAIASHVFSDAGTRLATVHESSPGVLFLNANRPPAAAAYKYYRQGISEHPRATIAYVCCWIAAARVRNKRCYSVRDVPRDRRIPRGIHGVRTAGRNAHAAATTMTPVATDVLAAAANVPSRETANDDGETHSHRLHLRVAENPAQIHGGSAIQSSAGNHLSATAPNAPPGMCPRIQNVCATPPLGYAARGEIHLRPLTLRRGGGEGAHDSKV